MTYEGLFNDEKIDHKWYLKIEQSRRAVYFNAVDKKGICIKKGNLFEICFHSGKIFLQPGVNPVLGFELDNQGKIITRQSIQLLNSTGEWTAER